MGTLLGLRESPGIRGRPKTEYDIAAMARAHSPAAIAALVKALDDPKLKVNAAVALLDRGFGRPTQMITTSDGSNPVLLHLLAAQAVSVQLAPDLERRRGRNRNRSRSTEKLSS